MNFCVLCYPSIGGSGVIATQLGTSLASRGHNVHFVAYDKPFRFEYANNLYFHKVTTNSYDLFKYPPYEFSLVNKIVEICTEYDIDIIHVHYAIPHVACAYLAKQIMKSLKDIKIVTTLHGTDVTIMGYDKRLKELLAFGLRESDVVTAVSNSLAHEATDIFCLNKNIYTIYNFINSIDFSPDKFNQDVRDQYANRRQKIIVHVSNLRSVKRPLDLIKAFALIKEQVDCKLLIVGKESNEKKLIHFIQESGLVNDVFLINKEQDVPSILAIADVFILPSEKESFGLAALEAMACGIPIVATKTGGLPELIIEGKTGFLSPIGDIKDIAHNSIKILTNEDLRNKFSYHARNRAVSVFNIDKIVTEYEHLFEKILVEKNLHTI